jgi:hypothetical protein
VETYALVLLTGAVSVLTAVITATLTRRAERKNRLVEERETRLARYREPLVRAAFDLQSRLYNIVQMRFLQIYVTSEASANRTYAIRGTQWLLGQYLGWSEILRREIQFLDLGSSDRNIRLVQLDEAVREILATDRGDLPPRFRLFRVDQRAVGELMILEPQEKDQRRECLGYASFLRQYENRASRLAIHLDSVEQDLLFLAAHPDQAGRLVALQRTLVDVIDLLDDDRSRFSLDLRGKIPIGEPLSPDEAERSLVEPAGRPSQAHFRFTGPPWPYVERWASSRGYRTREHSSTDEGTRVYCCKGIAGVRVVEVRAANDWVTIAAELRSRRNIERVLARPDGRNASVSRALSKLCNDVNVLLVMFDRPTLR